MPPHPLGSVSPAPLLLPSCHPAPGDTVSHPLMSEQAKNTVGVSEGGGCVHSGTPHRACAALLSVFLLVILMAGSCWRSWRVWLPPCLHLAVLGAPWVVQLQVEIFPSGSDVLWGAFWETMFVTDNISCTKKSSGWRMLHRGLAVLLLTQQVHSRPTYWASVISLQWSYSFQQSYRTCFICRGTTGWFKKTLKEQSQYTSSVFIIWQHFMSTWHYSGKGNIWDKKQGRLIITNVIWKF